MAKRDQRQFNRLHRALTLGSLQFCQQVCCTVNTKTKPTIKIVMSSGGCPFPSWWRQQFLPRIRNKSCSHRSLGHLVNFNNLWRKLSVKSVKKNEVKLPVKVRWLRKYVEILLSPKIAIPVFLRNSSKAINEDDNGLRWGRTTTTRPSPESQIVGNLSRVNHKGLHHGYKQCSVGLLFTLHVSHQTTNYP